MKFRVMLFRVRLSALLLYGALTAGITLPGSAAEAGPAPRPQAYQDFALNNIGDASRGRALFASEGTGCAKCHSVDGSSGRAGPDLFAIGDKFQRRELIRSVLEPSSSIAIGYGTTIVETKAGEAFQGVIKQATEAWLELMQADATLARINTRDIQSQRTGAASLMPEGLQAGLSLSEFSDLIAYLESLRQPANAPSAGRDMRETIQRAARQVSFEPFFGTNIRLDHPVWFGEVPGETNQFAVLEHFGRGWLIERSAKGDTQTSMIDLTNVVRRGGATGLLGLAFHPKFRENRKYYLKYQVATDGRIATVLDERIFSSSSRREITPPRELMRIPSVTQDHNGGCIEFGPDGYLYLGMGDTGPQRDPQGHGQDMNLLLGKILRIDVDRSEPDRPYGIPMDNPFRDKPDAKPEIWALGFREPWRFSFDSQTGDLWVGDVGQDRIEEVGIVRVGENHGWNVFEGFDRFSERYRRTGATYIPPVFAYPHSVGVSVTGGYVYRGERAPGMKGRYICADFESRRVWALTQTNRALESLVEIGRAPTRAVSFSQDSDGEIYMVGYDAGVIYRLGLERVDPTPLATRMLAQTSERTPVSWRFSLQSPAGGWFRPDFDDTSWTNAPGGFGTRGTPGAVVRTEWRGRDIWLRREFSLPSEFEPSKARSVALRLHHDEDAEVYLNGVEAAHLPRWTSGYIEVPIAEAAMRALRPGRNVIAIHCRQNNGGQYIDAGLVDYVESAHSPR